MAVYIAPISDGLGDLIVSLPAVKALIDSGERTYLVTRSPVQVGISERIAGIAGEITEDELKMKAMAGSDRIINLMDHPLQTDHIWGTAAFTEAYGPINILRIVEMIAKDKGVSGDGFGREKLIWLDKPELNDCIVFLPGAGFFVKEWPVEHWLALRALLSSLGEKVVVVGEPEECPIVKDLIAKGCDWLQTLTLLDAIDAVSSAKAVVSVDTGLMHVAVHQGIPTVAFFNRSIVYRRDEPNCRAIVAPTCAPLCADAYPIDPNGRRVSFIGCQRGADQRKCLVDWRLSCMGAITPDQVLARLRELNVAQMAKAYRA